MSKTMRMFNLSRKIRAIMGNFGKNAFADGGEVTNQAPSINYEQLIENARKEEKQKLYGKIQSLTSQIEVLTKSNNESLIAKAQAEAELKSFQDDGNKKDSAEVTKLKASIEALKEEIEKLKTEKTEVEHKFTSLKSEEDIRKEIEKEFELKNYRAEVLEKNKSAILSQMEANIKGSTKEEIDASIKKAIEESNEIRQELGLPLVEFDDKGNPVVPDGKITRKAPAPNPSSSGIDRQGIYGKDTLASLDPLRDPKAYKEWRDKAFKKR